MSEEVEYWYPKCILVYGAEVKEENLPSVLSLFDDKYRRTGGTGGTGGTEEFDTDISVGIFTKDNLYELRKYKTEMYLKEETYFLILSKVVLNVTEIGNVKIQLVRPNLEELKKFKDTIRNFGLTYGEFLIVTG